MRKGSHVRHQAKAHLTLRLIMYDTNSKSLSIMSSSSGVSSHTCKALNVMPADSFEVSASQITCTPDETQQESHPELQDSECKETNTMNADFGENDGGSIGLSTKVVGALAEHNLVITDNEFFENGDGDDLDDSTVIVECPSGKETKSLTLEEATNTILFCSSIVHDLVYEAATIAMNNKPRMCRWKKICFIIQRSSSYDGRGSRTKEKKKHSSKGRRKQRETEEETEVHIENDENASEAAAMMSNVGVPPPPSKGGESVKLPPKLENKYNCSIM
ncbi:hypothetical protein Bca52824_064238 [Brassica carinata]|uniref:Uncharacterized protein n=1 Tax=Brassica carinata TaxID=52824 RepID=A0A8X7QHJ4_BRACI|nr:hypothetical protein Bca52824_064238 [Brassica carinata]